MRGRIDLIMSGDDAIGVPSRNDTRLVPHWNVTSRVNELTNALVASIARDAPKANAAGCTVCIPIQNLCLIDCLILGATAGNDPCRQFSEAPRRMPFLHEPRSAPTPCHLEPPKTKRQDDCIQRPIVSRIMDKHRAGNADVALIYALGRRA